MMTTFLNNKVWCTVCECMINPIGHKDRCKVERIGPVITDAMRRIAWIGDALHRMDIRCAAILADVPHSSAGAFQDQFVSNRSMRDYMLVMYPDIKGSAHTIGTLFESRYYGEFRETYLTRLFPATASQIMDICPEVKFHALFYNDVG